MNWNGPTRIIESNSCLHPSTTQNSSHCLSIVQTLHELQQFMAMPTALGSPFLAFLLEKKQIF